MAKYHYQLVGVTGEPLETYEEEYEDEREAVANGHDELHFLAILMDRWDEEAREWVEMESIID